MPIILVGLKADLRDDPDIAESLEGDRQTMLSRQDGLALAEQINAAAYVECSTKSGDGCVIIGSVLLAQVLIAFRCEQCF